MDSSGTYFNRHENKHPNSTKRLHGSAHTKHTPQSWSSCCWPLSVFHLLSNYLVGTINTSIHTPKTFTHTHFLPAYLSGVLLKVWADPCVRPLPALTTLRDSERGVRTHVTLSLTHTCTQVHTHLCMSSVWIAWAVLELQGSLRSPARAADMCVSG